jgi:hypothetical protein
VNWKRIFAWSLLIFVAANAVAFSSGLTMARWDLYGKTIEEAIANSQIVRRLAIGFVAALLYWRFALGIPAKRLLHVLAVYALVQLLDIGVSALFGTPANELLDPWSMARSLLAAIIGLGAASLSSNNTFKPKPLRGSA